MELIIGWLQQNWFETTAAALGFIGIYLQIKQNPWYWFTAILMVLMYIVVFYQSKFYADMSFQFYYLAISIYGWLFWLSGKDNNTKKTVNTSRLTIKSWLLSLLASFILFIIIYYILGKYTDSDVVAGDAFTTALSFVATLLLARKILENWLFWIVVDLVSTGLYIYKGLYPTAILFFVLTVLAFVGYYKWKKALVNE